MTTKEALVELARWVRHEIDYLEKIDHEWEDVSYLLQRIEEKISEVEATL